MTERKRQTRSVRENEVIESDRVALVDAANRLVGHMIAKQVYPDVGRDVEMTAQESSAYHAALEFLGRQFTDGYRETEPFEKRVETEQTIEHESNEPKE